MRVRTWFLWAISVFVNMAQVQAQPAASGAGYDPHILFSPIFYHQSGNLYRAGNGSPGPMYWQNKASYQIEARLIEDSRELTGSLTLQYVNNSPHVLPSIWLQLDQNLFSPNSRGFAKLPATGNSRYGSSKSNFKGGYDISSVRILEGQGKDMKESPLTPIITDTRMMIPLPRPLKAGGATIGIKLSFRFQIPEYGADRMGVLKTAQGDIFALAQWYPRVCVFDDVQGWNTQPYLGAGEFYLEYGDFDVQITAPSNHVVVASGELLNPSDVLSAEELKRFMQSKQSDATVVIRSAAEVEKLKGKGNGADKTWKYRIRNARDFAWASSGAFVWDAARIRLAGDRSAHAQSVYPPASGGSQAWGRSTEYVKGSIENYAKRWFDYPYPAAVNVASNVGGMEYPGIVFCGAKATGKSLWGVTDHELGHTWFPMIVGSNERKYGWMDEGFNTFINMIAASDFNGGEYADAPPDGQQMAGYLFGPRTEAVMNTPDGMKEMNIGLALYFKPAYALHLLRNHITDSVRFDMALKQYIRDWAYKHPTPWDFFRSMENGLGEDLGWFWKGMFLENYKLDQAVTDISYVEGKPANGAIVTVVNREQMAMPLVISYRTRGGVAGVKKIPVEIWQNTAEYKTRLDTKEELEYVEIDPEHWFPDINPANNKWPLNR